MYIYNQYSFVPLEELLSSDGIGYPKLNFRVHTHALHISKILAVLQYLYL